MWFSLFATLLILAVTFYQALQGAFSAIINCIVTVLSAALAFGLYEDLFQQFLAESQPDHGRAILLMGIFIVSVLIGRTVVDQFITGNMQFPAAVDRAAGGVFGAVTAFVTIGMLSIGFQMLPFPPSFLGFERYALVEGSSQRPVLIPTEENRSSSGKPGTDEKVAWRDQVAWQNVEAHRKTMWLNQDGFTIGLMEHLSANALAGRTGLGVMQPDFLDYLHHLRDGIFRESLATVAGDTVKITGTRFMRENEPVYSYEKATAEGVSEGRRTVVSKRPLEPGMKRLIISVTIQQKMERAEDRSHIYFTSGQVRLVGRKGKDGPVRALPLGGISDPDQPHRIVELALGQDVVIDLAGASGPIQKDLMFEVPADNFEPVYLQYRQDDRDEIRVVGDEETGAQDRPRERPSPRPDDADASRDNERERPRPAAPDDPKGRVHVYNIGERDPVFTDELPFTLTDYSGQDLERGANNSLAGGKNLVAMLDDEWQPREGGRPPIERFDVPRDKRMLQVYVDQLDPQSWPGGLLGGMKEKLRNNYLVDRNGNEYMPVGIMAMADVDGQKMFQATYLNELERDMVRIPEFSRIKSRHLTGRYSLAFLFHVPPGTRPQALHVSNKEVSLRRYNLVAPN